MTALEARLYQRHVVVDRALRENETRATVLPEPPENRISKVLPEIVNFPAVEARQQAALTHQTRPRTEAIDLTTFTQSIPSMPVASTAEEATSLPAGLVEHLRGMHQLQQVSLSISQSSRALRRQRCAQILATYRRQYSEEPVRLLRPAGLDKVIGRSA